MVVTIKLRVEMTDEQIAAYCNEYGLDRSRFREDIKGYALNNLMQSPGLEASGFESVTVS